jgi:cathepsin A (carboxypeptidase C)
MLGVFSALEVPENIKHYNLSSERVSQAFQATYDLGISLKPQVTYLLANEIDVLIYQGNLDVACNTAGAKRWTGNLPWKGQAEFTSKDLKVWKSTIGGEVIDAGKYKEVNVKMVKDSEKTTRFTLLTVDRAGHMVSSIFGPSYDCIES